VGRIPDPQDQRDALQPAIGPLVAGLPALRTSGQWRWTVPSFLRVVWRRQVLRMPLVPPQHRFAVDMQVPSRPRAATRPGNPRASSALVAGPGTMALA
jgi:hypothetical protein